MFNKLPVTSNARTVGWWVDLPSHERSSATVAADVQANTTSAIAVKTTSFHLKLSRAYDASISMNGQTRLSLKSYGRALTPRRYVAGLEMHYF